MWCCDVSYLGICVSWVQRTQSTGWCLMMSFLFLSQWCASSTSHRRDRRKRLLGCGSWDRGCGNRPGGLWCRGEGIVNWFVSKQQRLLCVIKQPQLLVCPRQWIVRKRSPALFSISVFVLELSNFFLLKMFLLFWYRVGVNQETNEKLLKRFKTQMFICVSALLLLVSLSALPTSSFSPTTYSNSWLRGGPGHPGPYAARWC